MNSSKPRTIQKLFVPKPNKINNKNMPPLVACVFHPFDGPVHKMDSLPDGDNSNRLLIDHSTYSDFTINAGGTMTIRVLPTLPYCAVFQPTEGTSYTFSDPVLGSLTATFGNINGNIWSPCNGINQYSGMISTSSPYSVVTPPYSQTTFRIITSAWRIIYTGTVSNGCGIVTCRDLPVHFDSLSVVNAGGLKEITPSNTASGVSPKAASVGLVDFPTGAGGLDVGKSVFTRLDRNPWGIVKRNNRIYTWRDFYEQPFVPINSAIISAQTIVTANTPPVLPINLINPLITQTPTPLYLGINGWDNSFNATEIRISNINANVSFRLEVKICVEYLVLPNSPVYSLTKNPVKADLPVLDAVQERQSSLQPAMDQGSKIGNVPIERSITTSDLNKIRNTIMPNKNGNNANNTNSSTPKKQTKYMAKPRPR